MRRLGQVLTGTGVLLWGLLSSGCAMAAAGSCRPGDTTTSCCIKKFPLSPAESCAASPQEILTTLAAMDAAFQASRHMPIEDEEVDDFANNDALPEWKQLCIKNYVACATGSWTGNCYDCIRRCEGQQDWPFSMCRPRKSSQR